jgi:hypothetical protein
MASSGLVSHEHETLIHDMPADCLHSTVLDLNGFVCTQNERMLDVYIDEKVWTLEALSR